MTRYIAAYDVESPKCLAACRRIVELHRRHEMPATFFVVGRTLQADADEYRRLLDDPLFEVASHTWSHGILRDHPFCGPSLPMPRISGEIARGKAAVEKVFERSCLGLRPACGFVEGLKGAPAILKLIREGGLRYVSSQAWGPDYSLPAPLNQPFPYADEGLPELWELPCHGWHENLLKDHNRWGRRRLTLWPPLMPEAIPPRFLKTPQEEFEVHRTFLERAAAEDLVHVSLIWHPWSLHRFDPEMKMPELVFARARELGLHPTTYAELYEHLSGRD